MDNSTVNINPNQNGIKQYERQNSEILLGSAKGKEHTQIHIMKTNELSEYRNKIIIAIRGIKIYFINIYIP